MFGFLSYDATGYRVRRENGTIRTDYLYWGNTLLFETTGGKDINYVWAEGKLIAKVEATGNTYFTHDHLGSSKLQTDDTGNVLSTDVTKPFGPRICSEAIKDDFATLDSVNVSKSRIIHDAATGVIHAPTKGVNQKKFLANNQTVSEYGAAYTTVKAARFRLTEQDTKQRKAVIRITLLGKARVRVVGEDGIEYLSKEYSTKVNRTYSVTAENPAKFSSELNKCHGIRSEPSSAPTIRALLIFPVLTYISAISIPFKKLLQAFERSKA